MLQQPKKTRNANGESTDEPEHKKINWHHVLESSFWTDHIVAFVAVTVGLFLMSPILTFPGGNPKHLWYVGGGAWLIIGATIYWAVSGLIAYLEQPISAAAIAPAASTEVPPRVTAAPMIDYLVPGDGPTPPLGRGDFGPSEGKFFLFAGSSFLSTEVFPFVVAEQGGEEMLVIGKDGEKAWISAKFFDKDGKIQCKIEKNKIIFNLDKVFYADNPTPNTLVVYNKEDRIVFKLEYINENAMRIWGDFYLRKRHVTITDDVANIFYGGLQTSGSAISINKGLLPDDAPDSPRMTVQAPIAPLPKPPANAISGTLVIYNSGKRNGVINGFQYTWPMSMENGHLNVVTLKKAQDQPLNAVEEPIKSNTFIRIPIKLSPLNAGQITGIKSGVSPLYILGRFQFAGEGGEQYMQRMCFTWDEASRQWIEHGGLELNNSERIVGASPNDRAVTEQDKSDQQND